MKKIRIGCVPYLNGKPLAFGLAEQTDALDVSFAPPAVLAQKLRADELDVAQIPSIEYFRIPGLKIVPGCAIASDGPVESVRLFLRVPVRAVRTVALDPSSRTSVALTQILLRERYSAAPSLSTWNGAVPPSEVSSDAVLVIGDAGMKDIRGFADVLDLGAEWQRLTGLPFVYALWAVRAEVKPRGLEQILLAAKAQGLAAVDQIARQEAQRIGLPFERCRDYLSKSIRYDLGERELAGLKRFYEYAVALNLAERGRSIEFYGQ